MQRVKTATAVANKPPYSETGTPAFFTAGDAVAAIPATAPGQDWFNQVQEELLNLIKAAGLVPSATDDTQLREAVIKLIVSAVAGHNESGTAHADIRAAIAGINIPAASEAVAGILKLATQAQVLAGVGGGSVTPETLATRLAALPAPAVITGSARNLAMSATGLSALVSMTADELVVKDGTGNAKLLSGLALSASTAVMGAGGLDTGAIAGSTWYAVWAIAKTDGTAVLLLSASATAPTLPAGYSYMARVGWVRTDATANKYPRAFRQHGRRVQHIVGTGTNVTALPTLASGVAGNVVTPVYVAVAVGEAVPPTAKVIYLGLFCNTAQACAMVAPNPNYGNYISTTSPPPITQYPANAAGEAVSVSSLMLESGSIYWASNAPVTTLFCSGWEE